MLLLKGLGVSSLVPAHVMELAPDHSLGPKGPNLSYYSLLNPYNLQKSTATGLKYTHLDMNMYTFGHKIIHTQKKTKICS